MSLNHLPAEILFLLLQSLDNPRDLISLIRASRTLFRAYTRSPELVLEAVLKNAILPAALFHCLAIFHLPSPEVLKSELQQDFLDEYFQPKSDSFSFPTDKESMIELWHLHSRISSFVDDYSSRAMRVLITGSHHDPILTPSPLSCTERARFQRAFYRYELYSRIFPAEGPAGLDHSIAPAEVQFSQFLAKIKPWEAEEMSCVHRYFSTLIGGFLDDLEDMVVDAVLTAPGAVRPPGSIRSSSPDPPKRRRYPIVTVGGLVDDSVVSRENIYPVEINDKRIEGSGEMKLFNKLDLTRLDLFSKDGRFRSAQYISYLASLGSVFIQQLVSGDACQRKDLIRANTPVTRDFLTEALEKSPDISPETEIPADVNGDDPSRLNSGYYLVRYLGIGHDGTVNAPLRAMAYILWDSGRIADPSVSKNLEEAHFSNEARRAFKRNKHKSPEERLVGVRIPWAEFLRIEDEFGSTLSWYEDEDEH